MTATERATKALSRYAITDHKGEGKFYEARDRVAKAILAAVREAVKKYMDSFQREGD